MKKVNILMSTYNGEKYIESQLKSLLDQTYNNIEIHIRDDGSTDKTVEIIKKYCSYSNIRLYEGNNIGYKKSFFWLLNNCTDADYFAYCDQDDIWLPVKIEMAVLALEKYDSIPAMYMCDFYWSDENAKPLRCNKAYKIDHSLERYITAGDMNTFGFSEVFNKKAAEGIRNKDCTQKCVHDQVIYLYCLCNGKVVWDDKAYVYYRRFGNNASVQELVGGSKWSHFCWRVKTFLFTSSRDDVYARYKEFLEVFQNDIPKKDAETIHLYLNKGKRVRKACFTRRYRDTFIDECAIRLLFLIGRM